MEANKKSTKLTDSRYTLIATCAVIAVLVLTLAGFVDKSLWGKLSLNNKVIGLKSKANDQLAANLTNLQTLQKSYQDLGAKADLIHHALPTDPSVPDAVAEFEFIAKISGVQLNSVSPPSVTVTGAPVGAAAQSEDFSLSVTGSYPGMLALLKNLEKAARPIHVNSITLQGNTTSLQGSISLTTYWEGPVDTSIKMEPVK